MRTLPLVLLALLAGCSLFRPPPPAARSNVHYVLGPSWESAAGVWFYPRESFRYDETGLATVYAGPHPALTTDGEAFDQDAMAAAHQTLQLPAIARVTNLQNGRQVLVRVNDRGPASPGRIIELTRRVADLLRIPEGEPAQVRVQVEGGPSRRLADALNGAAQKLDIAAAPRGTVGSESLAPPPGIAQSAWAHALPGAAPAQAASVQEAPLPPERLPEQVTQVSPHPGQLWLRADEFSRFTYANQERARLAGLNPQIERVRQGRSETYRLRAGPFASVAQADAALDQARRNGVTDARIIVE